jgi:Tfp pilus assembly protein PilE
MLQNLRSDKGLTLLEVMFSMGILAITILSLMIMFPKMKMLVNKSGHKVAAMKACQTKMETIREAGYVSLASPSAVTEFIVLDNGEDQASTDDDVRANLITTATDVDSGGVVIAKKIMVQCTWIENQNDQTCSEYLDCILYDNSIE